MAKAKFDIKTEASRPLYAYVGVTDRAVEVVRDSVLDFQKRIADIDFEPKALRDRAAARYDELREPRRDPRGADPQAGVEPGHGEVGQALRTKAKTTRTQATKATRATTAKAKDAAKSTSDTARKQAARPKSSAKATGTTARRTAANSAKATVDAAKKIGD